jgi:hypothetical protein
MEAWRGNLEGGSKMEGYLEALLELIFCTQPPNFGVEAHMEAPTGVALRRAYAQRKLLIMVTSSSHMSAHSPCTAAILQAPNFISYLLHDIFVRMCQDEGK